LNVSMGRSSISNGSVYCDFLRGFVFGIRYLYLSYNHMISVVKGCFGGSSWCCVSRLVLYCFHIHSSLVLGMVIRSFPISVNTWALSCMIYIVGCVVFMSLSRLHSCRFIWIRRRLSDSCIYLVSFDCGWKKFFSIMLEQCLCCCVR
jgi:hypothetical protein